MASNFLKRIFGSITTSRIEEAEVFERARSRKREYFNGAEIVGDLELACSNLQSSAVRLAEGGTEILTEWDCEKLIFRYRGQVSEHMKILYEEDPTQERDLWKLAVQEIAVKVDPLIEHARRQSSIHQQNEQPISPLTSERVRVRLEGHPFMIPGPCMHRSHRDWSHEWRPNLGL